LIQGEGSVGDCEALLRMLSWLWLM